jgi:hypothetical protein
MDYPAKEFASRYPVARGGLVVDDFDESTIKSFVAKLLGQDQLIEERKKVRSYYFEGATDKDLTKRFINAVKETLK